MLGIPSAVKKKSSLKTRKLPWKKTAL